VPFVISHERRNALVTRDSERTQSTGESCTPASDVAVVGLPEGAVPDIRSDNAITVHISAIPKTRRQREGKILHRAVH
jgi:hypothetical protein